MDYLKIELTDEAKKNVVPLFCQALNRPEKVIVEGESVDNPESQEDFFCRSLYETIEKTINTYMKRKAAQDAMQSIKPFKIS